MVAFSLALLGVVPPFHDFTVEFPLSWVLSLFFLLPSLTLYYSVKDKLWAAVESREGRRGPSA